MRRFDHYITPKFARLERPGRDDRIIGVGPSNYLLAMDESGAISAGTGRDWKWAGVDADYWLIGELDEANLVLAHCADETLAQSKLQWHPLRNILGTVSSDLFACIGRASGVSHMLRTAAFCGVCGTVNEPTQSGDTAFQCPSCNYITYPKISPCAIGVVRKEHSILLAHNTNFPEGIYSAVAGFIEAGESGEQCFVREVFEETGITCQFPPKVIATQAWPFPSQLMIGFVAEYAEGTPQCDGIEIDHADWFDIDELPRVPPANISIAGTLIQTVVDTIRAEG